MANVFVIDDEKSIRSTLKDILEHEGFVIELASNGRKHLKNLIKSSSMLYYVIIRCPGMDGLNVLEKIQDIANTYLSS